MTKIWNTDAIVLHNLFKGECGVCHASYQTIVAESDSGTYWPMCYRHANNYYHPDDYRPNIIFPVRPFTSCDSDQHS